MNLTLNDFRAVLGKVNDGNVISTINDQGEVTGLKKVNYGRVFTKAKTDDNVEENHRMRDAFLNAITNSAEGRRAGKAFIDQVRAQLGVTNGPDYDKPLERREIKQILAQLDNAVGGAAGLIAGECMALRDLGLQDVTLSFKMHDMFMSESPLCLAKFKDVDSMMSAFGKKEVFNGFTNAQVRRFVTDNFARIKLLAFDQLYFDEQEFRAGAAVGRNIFVSPLETLANFPESQASFLRHVMTSLMVSYAKGEEPVLAPDRMLTAGEIPQGRAEVEMAKPIVNRAKALFDMVFPEIQGSYGDNFQNRALGRPTAVAFANVCHEAAELQNDPDEVTRRNNLKASIRTLSPEAGKIMDLPLEAIEGLSDGDKARLAVRLRTMVMSSLRTVAAGGRSVTPEQVMSALADAVNTVFKSATREEIVKAFVRKVNEERMLNLSELQIDRFAHSMLDKLSDDVDLKGVQAKVFSNVARKQGADDGLGEIACGRNLVAKIGTKLEEELNGPQVRDNAFRELGRHGDGVLYLEEELRLDVKVNEKGEEDPNGKQTVTRPLNDTLAVIAGKIAFLKKIWGHERSSELFLFINGNDNHDAKFHYHGDMADIGDPSKWPEQDRALLKRIDDECAKYTIADINDTVAFYETGLSSYDATDTYYLMGRDKAFNMADASANGLLMITQIKMSSLDTVIGLVDVGNNSLVQGDLHTYYDTMAAILNPLVGTNKFPPYSEEGLHDKLMSFYSLCQQLDNSDRGIFGTFKNLSDPELVKLLSSFGLKIKDLSTGDGFAKFIALAYAKKLAGDVATGLSEWVSRMTGLDVKSMSAAEIPKLIDALNALGDKADPLTAFTEGDKKVVSFLQGKVKAEEIDFDQPTMDGFAKALRSLNGGEKSARCKVGGVSIELKADRGELSATVAEGAGKGLPIAMNRSVADLLAVLETKIANHPDKFPGLVGDTLPKLVNGAPQGMSESRARELCTKVLVAKLHLPTVAFAAMDLATLVTAARGAVAGTYTAENVPKEASKAYNSADIVAVQKAYVNATDIERDTMVKMSVKMGVRTLEQRQNEPPSEKEIHDCISELVMNLDTSAYDRDAVLPKGTRLQKVLKAWGPELKFILADVKTATATLPLEVRGTVETILGEIAKVGADDLGKLADIEDDIGKFITETMDSLQKQVTALFDKPVAVSGSEGETWKKSLEEMTNVNGLDPNSPNGKFVLDVLKNYFSKADGTEKRAMLAAYLRNGRADFTIGRQIGELMKGAGPIFQKMLQGLPIESFDEDTKAALKDMKSQLSEIPEPVVRAQLLDLVKSSNGEILSVEVRKSIGCATVGQALLCHIVTKAHPYTGEDVVIKLRRPNVQTAALREYAVIREIAKASGGEAMANIFDGQFNSILKELDFTLESENIDVAGVHYDRPKGSNGEGVTDIRSMGRFTTAPATMGALVLQKVNGDTLDGFMAKNDELLKEIRGKFEKKVATSPNSDVKRTVVQSSSIGDVGIVRSKLRHSYERMVAARSSLEHLVKVWTNEVLFRTGFFHGDLHAGNMMVDVHEGGVRKTQAELTFIDFGNVTRLSKEEQKGVAKLFVVAGYSFNNTNPGESFVEALGAMLTGDAKKLLDDGAVKSALTAEINDIMRMGQYDKLAGKVIAALAAVQRHKITLPEGLAAFLSSLTRLKGAMSQLDRQLAECELTLQRMEFAPGAVDKLHLERFEGKLPCIAEFREFLVKTGKNVEKNSDDEYRDQFYDLRSEIDKAAKSPKTIAEANTFVVKGREYGPLFGDDGKDLSTVRAFAETFKGIKFEFSGNAVELEYVGELLTACDDLEKRLAMPQSQENDEQILQLKKTIRGTVVSIYQGVYTRGYEKPPKHVEFNGFEAVIGACVSDNQSAVQNMFDLDTLTSLLYGTVFVDPKIDHQRDLADAAAREANAQLDETERLGELRLNELKQIAVDFRFPGGPAGIEDIDEDQLKDVLEVNLKMAAKRLGYAEGERLAPGELKYLATFFRTIRQVRDTRNKFMRGVAMTATLNKLRTGTYDPIRDYELTQVDDIPMVRAVNDLSEGALANLSLSEDALEFARQLRA